ncbi:MAG TPA: cytochrome C oxidase assembly protein [Marinilabiliales bacterium]|jgi:cytochrome d ubiquinol oxidase subunit II|nr:cytochrome d ubiquinol oxidase subunit II [Salinivirgaceae bacterium]OFX39975.1 MAG: cytochrome C oxidase assembly protein [Bacteroidetes bacterium GWA2_40_14]OFX61556.1 MAG: cytochrome C oxidase assembly protein [Bacteroidetes bacterium GWC2_40_13]OFX73568.1 MAG: cytochrome C oxidase assembly protein [Bacteroidetes bacterium GWD2_40_43]OFX90757.1 MAG: cytochrome C oxidase assembly protein [Bacteroidetes bacterium GWE2_40_63]OFY20611.1 MAG: cytochrome C oxidase assembly protein [Bacteroidet
MEDSSYIFFQHYWWLLVSLLGAILVFLLFVQGGQTLIYSLGKTEDKRKVLVNALGRKWEFTFTTLVTFGGAFFASFPLFYSTSFGGAYWVWMAILFCFVLQAVSYEFRTKPNNVFGKKTFELFLFLNGLLGTVLIGTAVGTFYNGAEFSVNKMNLTDLSNPVISQWQTPWHGLEAVLTFHNVALGLAVFFLSRVLANLYFINAIEDEEIIPKAKKSLIINTIPFLVFFLFFVIVLLVKEGYAVNPQTGEVYMEKFKYLHNFLQMPIVLIVFLLGVVGVLFGIGSTLFCKVTNKGIWSAGVGTVFAVLGLLLVAGYNNTAYYPSNFDLQSSLTIFNSSSSKFTLKAMSVVSLLIPFVLAYIVYAWRAINNKPLTQKELDEDNDQHAY